MRALEALRATDTARVGARLIAVGRTVDEAASRALTVGRA